MDIKQLETSDIKSMLTVMNTQIENSDNAEAEFLKEYYKDFINSCKYELLKRGELINK